jgi:FkbM family methyltransferase
MAEIFHHHRLFDTFQPFDGWVEAGFEAGPFGANIRDWLLTGESKGITTRRRCCVGNPDLSEEYFEWIALLAAVATARDRFRIFELGAGWGRWSIYAAMLVRQRGLPFHSVAVEPEPSHFEWLQMAFRDNGLDPVDHDLRQAVVGTSSSTVMLAETGCPKVNYGQYVAEGIQGLARRLRSRHEVTRVNAVALASLLETDSSVDLIDMDIQGMEAKVLSGVSARHLRNVRIVHIGTHSHGIEASIRASFRRWGWLNVWSFPCRSECSTPFGTVRFEDGVETWVNPAAETVLEAIQRR